MSIKDLPQHVQAFLNQIKKPYKTKFWGSDYVVRPALVNEIHGDGLQIVALQPLDTRPQFYVLCIDSSVVLESDGFDWDGMLLQPIEEEYDQADRYEHEWVRGRYLGRYLGRYQGDKNEPWTDTSFPMLNWSGGSWWQIANFISSESHVFMASTIKEAKRLAYKEHGERAHYISPYRYASKGNNFYEFHIEPQKAES